MKSEVIGQRNSISLDNEYDFFRSFGGFELMQQLLVVNGIYIKGISPARLSIIFKETKDFLKT